jgi:hypothetical protein
MAFVADPIGRDDKNKSQESCQSDRGNKGRRNSDTKMASTQLNPHKSVRYLSISSNKVINYPAFANAANESLQFSNQLGPLPTYYYHLWEYYSVVVVILQLFIRVVPGQRPLSEIVVRYKGWWWGSSNWLLDLTSISRYTSITSGPL